MVLRLNRFWRFICLLLRFDPRRVDFSNSLKKFDLRINILYRREKFIATNFDYVEPETIPIDTKKTKLAFFQYLPVKKTIRRTLSDESLRKYIIRDIAFTAGPDVSHTNDFNFLIRIFRLFFIPS